MSTIRIELPRLHEGQRQIHHETRRFNVVACGRRWGKTVFGIDRLVHPALEGYPAAWFAPTYKLLLEPWREMRRLLAPVTKGSNASEHRIDLVTGGVVEFWSLADNPDVARGRRYRRAVIDEAAMVRTLGEAWQAAIRPTLADFEGDAFLLSTPKGRNFFWECFARGNDPAQGEWAAWQKPTSTNPYIPPAEIEAMRAQLPERIYRQEVLAEFLEDGGGVFRRVREAATALPQERAQPGHSYVAGVDWGKHHDFTVITVIDETGPRPSVACVDRFNQIDYAVQIGRLNAILDRFQPRLVVAERNSMGEPLIEQLQRRRVPVEAFLTTNQSKSEIIEGVALAFERGELALLDVAHDRSGTASVVVAEHEAYEVERLPSGAFRYAAPEGFHDDTVMSLALARYAHTKKRHKTGFLHMPV